MLDVYAIQSRDGAYLANVLVNSGTALATVMSLNSGAAWQPLPPPPSMPSVLAVACVLATYH